MNTRTRKDWILWGALGCALVSTAHAEYTLATAAHFNEYVALAVPGALDLYVVRALQQRRDVFVAVLAMVAANVTSHLIAGGVLGVQWPVIAAVGAVAPLIVWRVYSLKYTRNRSELLWDLKAGEVSTPVLETSTQPEYTPSTAPDRIPDWMEDEYPASTYPAPVLVPPLPPEYTSSAVTTPVLELEPTDYAYLDTAREYAEFVGKDTSVRGLMKHANIGQKRAGRLLAHLEAEEQQS